MKISEITIQEFNNFSINHKYTSYYQSSAYGYLMNRYGLSQMYIGIYENGTLIGASLILSKPSFLGFKYGYAPRGILIDYTNYEILKEIANKLKEFLFKNRFIFLKIDPIIDKEIRNNYNKLIQENNDYQRIKDELENAGFFHCGYSKAFESVKPRYEAILDISQESQQIYKNLCKQIRNKINKATKLGIQVYEDNSKIEEIYHFIKNKDNCSLNYYKSLINSFQSNCEIYVAEINTEDFVDKTRELYEKELEKNSHLTEIIGKKSYKGKNIKDVLNKKMQSDQLIDTYKKLVVQSTQLLKNHPNNIIIGGGIYIKHNNTISLVIDGYNKDFSKFYPLYLIKWELIKKYSKTGINTLNLGGLTNSEVNEYHGLNESRLGFGASKHEYIGEFNLITNDAVYALYRTLNINDSIKNIKK